MYVATYIHTFIHTYIIYKLVSSVDLWWHTTLKYLLVGYIGRDLTLDTDTDTDTKELFLFYIVQ